MTLYLGQVILAEGYNPSKNEQEQANNHVTFGLIFLTRYGVSQTTAIYITFTYCKVAKPLRLQGSKISLPDIPGPLEKSDGPPQFPH